MSLIEFLEPRRLLAAGDLDPTFGAGEIDLGTDAYRFRVTPDGKVLFVNTNDTLSRRSATDFTLDTSFGTSGVASLGGIFDYPTALSDAIPLADGKFLVCGEAKDGTGGILVRLRSDGQLDATFGTGGVVHYPPSKPADGWAIDRLAEQSDGKIVMVVRNDETNRVVRVNADGLPDASFAPFAFGDDDIGVNVTLQLQSTGKIILTGIIQPTAGVGSDAFFSMLRLNTDGTLDTAFGDSAGFLSTHDGARPSTLVLPDDRILVAGLSYSFKPSFSSVGYIQRLDADGKTDPTFGTNGTTNVALDSFGGFELGQIAITPQGQIVAVGYDMAARFSMDGTLDSTFGRVLTAGLNVLPQANGDLVILKANGIEGNTLFRLQGSGTVPYGHFTLSNGVLTVTGTAGNESISATVNDADGLLTAAIPDRGLDVFGRIYDAADVQTINISARGGNDEVTISVGATIGTSVSGGDGNDTLIGGRGPDSLSGNAGNDEIDGGGGNDRVAGNGGRDKLAGGAGDDRLYGGSSGDWLAGQGGNDTLWGEGGNDHLNGGSGADVLHGNAGDDVFASNDGAVDQLFGDRGHDTATADPVDLLAGIEIVGV